jgi:hypothetical protein
MANIGPWSPHTPTKLTWLFHFSSVDGNDKITKKPSLISIHSWMGDIIQFRNFEDRNNTLSKSLEIDEGCFF